MSEKREINKDEQLRKALQDVYDTVKIGLAMNFEGMLTYHSVIDSEEYASVVAILQKHGIPIVKWEADHGVFRFFLRDVKRL